MIVDLNSDPHGLHVNSRVSHPGGYLGAGLVHQVEEPYSIILVKTLVHP
jgi:hypothetical protein